MDKLVTTIQLHSVSTNQQYDTGNQLMKLFLTVFKDEVKLKVAVLFPMTFMKYNVNLNKIYNSFYNQLS